MANPWGMNEWRPEDWLGGQGFDDPYNDPFPFPQTPPDPGSPTPSPGPASSVPSDGITATAGGFLSEEGGGPGGDGGGGGVGRPSFNFKDAPLFKAPKFSFAEQFRRPGAEDVLNDPSYRFRSDEGQRALERSAAGRGVLRTGGTLKDIASWAQQFASQEYGNVFDRALQEFTTKRDTAFGNFDREFRGAQAEYAPLLAQWQFLSGAERDAALAQFQRDAAERLANRGGGGDGIPWEELADILGDGAGYGGGGYI